MNLLYFLRHVRWTMRDTNGESRVHGIYPGGEGAGYAGGIMSAAMDGLRLADDVMKRYHPVY
jgi:uncharacterized protein